MKSLLPLVALVLLTHPVFCQAVQLNSTYWDAVQELCGKAYSGTVIHAPENDTLFTGKALVIHIRACEDKRIRIPLIVGDDYSRTWILTRNVDSITLKHDHRHKDGTEDQITQYGGSTSNTGSATMQMFPADQYTADLLPAAASNVWWIEIVPGAHMIYSLRRLGTERFFSIRFDLSSEIPTPDAPWGWEE